MGHSETIFDDEQISKLARAGAAVALIDSSGSLILWSSPAALAYFGINGAEFPIALDGSVWPTDRFAELTAGEAPLAGMALEPLRAKKPGIRPVTMSVRRLQAADGQTALIVVLLSLRGDPVELPLEISDPSKRDEPKSKGPIRFLWQSDQTGIWHFPDTTSPFCKWLVTLLDGTVWPGRDAKRIREPDNGLREALAQKDTFVGFDAELFDELNTKLADLVVSGTPVFSSIGVFEGFRGFGFYKPVDHHVIPPVHDSKDETELLSKSSGEPESKTVNEHIGSDDKSFSPPIVSVENSAPILKSQLSDTERHAFREIARALGAKPISEISAQSEPGQTEKIPESLVSENQNLSSGNSEPDLHQNIADEVKQNESFTKSLEDLLSHSISDGSNVGNPKHARPASSLHASMDLVRVVLDRLPIGVLISRGDVPIVMNETLLQWLGYGDADEFHAYGGIDRLFRGRVPDLGPTYSDANAMLITRKDGNTLALSTHLQTVQWGDLPASMMTFDHISEHEYGDHERILIEAGLVEAHELKAILDTATDGVLVLDEQGHILSLNRSAEALFGIEEAALIGDRFTAIFSEETRQRASEYFNGLKDNGVATILNDGREVVGLDNGGRSIPLFMTMGRITDTPVPKYCVVLRDITVFKQTERELVQAKRKAETASTLKSDFLAKISHEVRTPLSAIIGFAEIMYEERFGPLGTTRYKDYLKDILKSGAHVVNLINDLLDLSKIEAGRADLDFTTLQPNAVVASTVKLLQNEAARRRVILRQSLAGNLPSVIADERSLMQIMLNILSNAIKFTDEGGQVIVSTARTVKGDLVIRVKDTGVGMSDQELRTALEPFRQIKTSRHTGGTGLGLPLTKALVEANRASMTILSAKNAGTLVEITFPSTRVLAS